MRSSPRRLNPAAPSARARRPPAGEPSGEEPQEEGQDQAEDEEEQGRRGLVHPQKEEADRGDRS